jgi:hypothetical protein
MRERIAAIGWDGAYVPYRGGSHAVHGTWADVLMRHIVYAENGFSVQWSLGVTDSRLQNPTARINLKATIRYVRRWFEEEEQVAVDERIGVLIDDLEAVSLATESAKHRG